MFKDYQDSLSQKRQAFQISQADFEAWKSNTITVQLFEDAELLSIDSAENVNAINADVAGLQAAKLNGVQDTVNFVIDWTPDYLEGGDE